MRSLNFIYIEILLRKAVGSLMSDLVAKSLTVGTKDMRVNLI